MNRSHVLLADAAINLVLGVLLVVFPKPVVEALGVPAADSKFYPSILGAVLIGIAIALSLEWRRQSGGLVGLGLGGAVAINLCGGLCLAGWLASGGLEIPVRGQVFLWALVAVLVGISLAELATHRKGTRQ